MTENDNVVLLSNYSYEGALLGATADNRAVYSYELMIKWLVERHNFTAEDAEEWILNNTVKFLPYLGERAPIIVYPLEVDEDATQSE